MILGLFTIEEVMFTPKKLADVSAADAKSKIAAGADLVQIYTGLIYQGAPLVRDAALAIKSRGETAKR